MSREIRTYKNYFKEFIESLNEKERKKVGYALDLLRTMPRLSVKFVKFIEDGLYELRIEYSGNIYRIFFIFEEENIVILFNCFHKKTRTTPRSEIELALKLKAEYNGNKQSKPSEL